VRARTLFTDRRLGNLATHVGDDAAGVGQHRAALAAALQLEPAAIAWMDQVHGRDVAVVDGPASGPAPRVDALVTATPGTALAVLVADCRPVLLADDRAGVVAAVHAGRAGVQLDVVGAAVRQMRRLGAGEVRAHVGPGVCAACYPVPAAMRDEVAATVPASWASARDGSPALDLLAGVRSQLASAGVEYVEAETTCTAEDSSLFSHRRDGGQNGGPAGRLAGRFAGVVVLDP